MNDSTQCCINNLVASASTERQHGMLRRLELSSAPILFLFLFILVRERDRQMLQLFSIKDKDVDIESSCSPLATTHSQGVINEHYYYYLYSIMKA